MIGFLIAELGEWLRRDVRRTVSLAALALALAALVGPLHPLMLSVAAVAVFLVSGWVEGRRYQAPMRSYKRLLAFPISAGKIVGGVALTSFVAWLGLLVALSPLLAASAIAWGVPASVLASFALCWMLAFLVASSAGFMSCFILERAEGLAGMAIVGAWLVASFFVDWMKSANPFIQAWLIIGRETGPEVLAGMAVEAAVFVLFLVVCLPSIAKAKRKRDD